LTEGMEQFDIENRNIISKMVSSLTGWIYWVQEETQ